MQGGAIPKYSVNKYFFIATQKTFTAIEEL